MLFRINTNPHSTMTTPPLQHWDAPRTALSKSNHGTTRNGKRLCLTFQFRAITCAQHFPECSQFQSRKDINISVHSERSLPVQHYPDVRTNWEKQTTRRISNICPPIWLDGGTESPTLLQIAFAALLRPVDWQMQVMMVVFVSRCWRANSLAEVGDCRPLSPVLPWCPPAPLTHNSHNVQRAECLPQVASAV